MPGALKACVAGRVHVQQVAGTRPLVASGGISGSSRSPREAMAMEHLPDRRVAVAGSSSHQARPPAGVPANLTDLLLLAGVQEPRRAMRTAGTIGRPCQRVAVCERGVGISMPPS